MHTNLHWIDWAIMIVAVIVLRSFSLSTRRYMKSISDFLSANRVAGRYLLTISHGMGATGVISFIAMFELFYKRGLSPSWWSYFSLPVGTIMLMTGWVYYRFRETRAMTMAQFLEMRYSRKLRIFAGILCWTSGVINFGIFPAVAARFFIYFCGLPDHFHLPGIDFAIPTIALVMFVDLAFAISFVNMGGQVSVMVTDCVQGMFCSFAFLTIAATILIKISWPEMVQALSMAPKHESMINPFHTSKVDDFNIWYYLIAIFGSFFSHLSWQGAQGFLSCARTPHEQKMGGIIGGWRGVAQGLCICLLGLMAVTVMKLPQFANEAHTVGAALSKIPNEYVQSQMRVPIVMAHVLPIAIKGLLGTVFLFFSFTCHDTYMHSWGSIFIQDIYLPIRNKAIDTAEHIKLLRMSILGVAAFAFIFSLLYKPTEHILFFFAITGTIWLGGSGAVIIGGLYWKRGTTPAAYAALIVGATMGIGGLILPKVYLARTGHEFPINNQWLWFIAMVSSLAIYCIVSLITSHNKEPYNLTRMLHRGKYKIESDHVPEVNVGLMARIAGITKEFSKSDRVLAIFLLTWHIVWFAFFIVFSIINLLHPVSDSAWAMYHFVHSIVVPCILAVPATIWFTIGGVIDLRALFRDLATAKRDVADDGRFHGYKDDESPEQELQAESCMPETPDEARREEELEQL